MEQSRRGICASCLGHIQPFSPSTSFSRNIYATTSSAQQTRKETLQHRKRPTSNDIATTVERRKLCRKGSLTMGNTVRPLNILLLVVFGLLCQTVSASKLSASTTEASKVEKRGDTTSSGLATATGSGSNANLPRAFDSSVGTNFTTSACENFFQSMLHDPNLAACHPVSLMLQTSQSWFEASQSLVSITQALDASCNAPFGACSSVMSNYANQLLSDDVCLQDYTNGNPLIVKAHAGTLAYEAVYHATCLRDDTSSDNYCYADASTNKSAPWNAFFYLLPLGNPLPAGVVPSCSSCLKNTMDIFSACATNSSQPCSSTYSSAAQQLDMYCGPSFAITNVPTTSSASFVFAQSSGSWLAMSLAAAVSLLLFF